MSQIITISNQKGGVGKTTTAINLGAALALLGRKVLIVDLDIQCNTTLTLYQELSDDEEGLFEVLMNEWTMNKIIRSTRTPGLFLAPAGENLVNADLSLSAVMGRERVLETSLEQVRKAYDFILIDTSPYLGLLTINALVAADYILIPVSCEFLPMLGLKQLLKTVEKVRAKLSPRIDVLGFLLTMYDRREKITEDVEDIMRTKFGKDVFSTVIRVNTRQKMAPAEGKTIFEFEHSPQGKGSSDYIVLAEEVLGKLLARQEEHIRTRREVGNGAR